jgi:uncharacterized protein with HEPN domain
MQSMSENAGRNWLFYLSDMLEFAEKFICYTEGFEQDSFIASGLNFDATVRNLELMGEAATHIPAEIRERYHEIPWRQIIATRNRLIHGYLGIDDDVLWDIIQNDIPNLIIQLKSVRN